MPRDGTFDDFLEDNPQFLPNLRGYCDERTHSRQSGSSEICFEEAVESLCKNWTGISKPPMVYAKTIVRRTASKRPALTVEQQMESPLDKEDGEPSLLGDPRLEARREFIRDRVLELSPADQQFLGLWKHYTHREVAALLGKSPSDVLRRFRTLVTQLAVEARLADVF